MHRSKKQCGVLSRASFAVLSTGVLVAAGLAAVPAASAATPFEQYVVINEVESNVPSPGGFDYIELYNNGPSAITFTNAAVADNDNTHVATISGTIAAGGYFVVENDNPSTPGNFGLGNADSARLYAEGQTPATASPIDTFSWTAHSPTSYGRYPDGTGGFVTLDAPSKGAANVFTSPGSNPDPTPWLGVVINEVESNGDTYDWVELYNTNTAPVNISGAIVSDNNNSHQVTVPNGTTLTAAGTAGAYAVVEVDNPAVTGAFGLGASDQVRLFAPGTVDVATATTIDGVTWSTHSPTTYGLDRGSSPTLKGIFRATSAATKGTANTFHGPPSLTSAELVINEVESLPATSPAFPGDWIELANRTNAPLDIGGLLLTDSSNLPYTIPVGTVIPANGYLPFWVDDVWSPNGNFGLGNVDSARLFNAGANFATDTPIDATSWTAHAANTWGRTPNKTGPFQNTLWPTPGAPNP